MTLNFISSEESGSENGEEVLIVCHLPSGSTRVGHRIIDLDKQSL